MPLSYMHGLGLPRDLPKPLRIRQRKNDLNRQISVMKQEDMKPRPRPSNKGGILGLIFVWGNILIYIYIYILVRSFGIYVRLCGQNWTDM